MKITDEIHMVDGADHCRVFLVVGEDGLNLIDVGDPGDGLKVLAYLKVQGWNPVDIKRILLTHKHGDHVGDLAMMVRATGAKILAHEADADAIDKLSKVDVRLKDGDVLEGILGGLQVVHVPGHTAGCIMFYSPSRKVLFTGDALINRGGLQGPVPAYCENLAQAHQSLRDKVAPLDYELCCFSHVDLITEGASKRVQEVIARLQP